MRSTYQTHCEEKWKWNIYVLKSPFHDCLLSVMFPSVPLFSPFSVLCNSCYCYYRLIVLPQKSCLSCCSHFELTSPTRKLLTATETRRLLCFFLGANWLNVSQNQLNADTCLKAFFIRRDSSAKLSALACVDGETNDRRSANKTPPFVKNIQTQL